LFTDRQISRAATILSIEKKGTKAKQSKGKDAAAELLLAWVRKMWTRTLS
jgi:hypothetical protein